MHRFLALGAVVLLACTLCGHAAAWSWPSDGAVLEPFTLGADAYASGQHRGIDIGGDEGADVRAPASGVVTFAGSLPTYGRGVTILTSDGYSVTLVHLGSTAVSEGAAVSEGTPIGTLGSSGTPEHSTPNVHLGIRRASDEQGYVDPLGLLPPRGVVPAPSREPASAPEPAAAIAAIGSRSPAVSTTAGPPPAPTTGPAAARLTAPPVVPPSAAPAVPADPGVESGPSAPVADLPQSTAAPATDVHVAETTADPPTESTVEPAFEVTAGPGVARVASPSSSVDTSRAALRHPVRAVTGQALSDTTQAATRPPAEHRSRAVSRAADRRSTHVGGAVGIAGEVTVVETRDDASTPLRKRATHAVVRGDRHPEDAATVAVSPRALRADPAVRVSGNQHAAPAARDDVRVEVGQSSHPVFAPLRLGLMAALAALLAAAAWRRRARRIDGHGEVLLPHDADLLRELDPAHRARVHDRRRGRVRTSSAAART